MKENNQFVQCTCGGPYQDAALPGHSEDIIVRDNFYYDCLYGVWLVPYTTGPTLWKIKRIILEGNAFDIPTSGAPYGELCAASSPSDKVFEVLVARANRIRGLNGSAPPSSAYGISINHARYVTLDYNTVEPLDPKGLFAAHCTTITALNNRRLSGELVRVWNDDTDRHVPELTTDADNLVYAL